MALMRASQLAAVSDRGHEEWGGQQLASLTLHEGTLRSRRGSASVGVTQAMGDRALATTQVSSYPMLCPFYHLDHRKVWG